MPGGGGWATGADMMRFFFWEGGTFRKEVGGVGGREKERRWDTQTISWRIREVVIVAGGGGGGGVLLRRVVG